MRKSSFCLQRVILPLGFTYSKKVFLFTESTSPHFLEFTGGGEFCLYRVTFFILAFTCI
jgi:hypothetical protein